MAQYKTVLCEAQDEFVEKRSRFIGYAKPVQTEEEALAFIAEKRSKHWDATHNVYAYILRSGPVRYSDDGEPQGTAGMPILENLKSRNLTLCTLAVVRYFGGVKLGAGGLTRAYFSAAKEHLEKARFCEILPCETWAFPVEYAAAESVKKLLEKHGLTPQITYTEKAEFILRVKTTQAQEVRRALSDLLCGKADITVKEVSDGYFRV